MMMIMTGAKGERAFLAAVGQRGFMKPAVETLTI
jgi:hypothetical protein